MTTNRHPDLLDRLWRLVSAGGTMAALLAGVVGVLAVTFILPQQPSGLDRVAAENWLAETATGYRGVGSFLAAAGAFDLLNGWFLRILCGLLALSLLLRLADAAALAWQARRRRITVPSLPPTLSIRAYAMSGPLSRATDELRAALEARCGPVIAQDEANATALYARQHRWGVVGPVLACLGLLIALGGLWLNQLAGWRAAEVALAPGNSALVAPGPGVRISMARITGPAEGAASSILELTQSDRGQQTIEVAPLRPGRWGNLWAFQIATGPTLFVTAHDNENRPLPVQTLAASGEARDDLRILFRQNQTEQGFALPAYNLTFRVVSYPALPEKGIVGPVFLVEAYRGDSTAPAASALVEEQAAVAVDGITVTLRRDRYAVIRVAHLPGLPVSLLGGLIALLGAVIAQVWGTTQVWADIVAAGETVSIRWFITGPAIARAKMARWLHTL